MDTIFALASARGKSGVAVVRVSGPGSFHAVGKLCNIPSSGNRASLRTLKSSGLVLDQALVLRFDAPNSFTGEDVVELHLHGSVATVNAVLGALASIDGLRLAEPGEFTRRALENEKLDLARVEGLGDLIDAETEAQRRQALKVFTGALGEKVELWRSLLIRSAALLEATIDFADEDVPVDVTPEVQDLLKRVLNELQAELAGVAAAERIRDGFEVAIVGSPNVGKSTLLNALAGREAALTSSMAGTTRDVIEVHMDLKGLPVTFLDTAGIRDSDDAVENMGVKLAVKRARSADLRVIVLSSRDETPAIEPTKDDIQIVSKADIVDDADVSSISGAGLDNLLEKIEQTLSQRALGVGVAIHDRHRLAIKQAIGAIETAQTGLEVSPEMAEVVAEDLRIGIHVLDALVGRIDVEHVLDEIFSKFCIGK
ncbi:MAG: tRNA uridine-5-carboxymethylaminomethyl(34) synthesis GTPase MnmE [Boseongicola sp.]|nr:MAG: tRNA uridine-5-carboxymethylaminomethyl(34) synthesis GTPase MnmE [Boseongicola sp.]